MLVPGIKPPPPPRAVTTTLLAWWCPVHLAYPADRASYQARRRIHWP